MTDPVSRVRKYLDRRAEARGYDREEIHGFDVTPDGGFFLHVSDLEAILAMITTPAPQTNLDGVYVIPRELTDEEWSEVKYNVDRKANPDIDLWRIKEAVKYANFIAGHRGRQMIQTPAPVSDAQPTTWGIFTKDGRFTNLVGEDEENAKATGEEYFTTDFIIRPLYEATTPPLITDEMVERTAKSFEKLVKQSTYGWSDEDFEIWWNHDPYFVQAETGWGDAFGVGTRKARALWETRTVLETALETK